MGFSVDVRILCDTLGEIKGDEVSLRLQDREKQSKKNVSKCKQIKDVKSKQKNKWWGNRLLDLNWSSRRYVFTNESPFIKRKARPFRTKMFCPVASRKTNSMCEENA